MMNTYSENGFEKAFIQVIDERIQRYEENLALEPRHVFSKAYNKRKNRLIRSANKSDRKFGVGFNFHRAGVVLAAIILALAMTTTVIAIVKPQIFYKIKSRLVEWDIRFEQKTNGSDIQPFEYRKPKLPKEYKLVEEDKIPGSQELSYKDESTNTWIDFSQDDPNGVSFGIDAEHGKFYKKKYNGCEILVWDLGEVTSFIFNDGYYIYMISGNCSRSILYGIVDDITEKK